ncbi:MAG TPA: gamma-glutamylcyclotransferase family protein [Pyrinomonadaceae bacterium]|nr:gamma-glutamylcyclotransferase family protein [Pyrinomonadaceae bacterium]
MSTESLFAYGTLQLEPVQLATFRRRLVGTPDVMTGYELKPLIIHDQNVIAISGKNEHRLATFTGRSADRIAGVVFAVTPEELQSADEYEVEPCQRLAVTLESGRTAWVYVDGRIRQQSRA